MLTLSINESIYGILCGFCDRQCIVCCKSMANKRVLRQNSQKPKINAILNSNSIARSADEQGTVEM